MKGISTAPMLLVIISIALALIRQSSNPSIDAVKMVRIQQISIQAFYQAQSAINWGLTQPWSFTQKRQCQSNTSMGGWSCLYLLSKHQAILEGSDQEKKIKLWQRVKIIKQWLRITPIANGWIDINPL